MSAWPGKYVIGLTGNIATGKSVVRKMLEHLGAYGVDADALGHRAIAKGAPGYRPVVEFFGKWILAPDEQIDRTRLGRVVFSDPEALARLEAVVHPLVAQAVDVLVRRAKHSVIVIEAIKLLESGLRERCDTLWVTTAPQEIQLARLMQKRKMSEPVARQRIAVQPAQELKIKAGDVVIHNDRSFEDTWQQVQTGWQTILPVPEEAAVESAIPVAEGELVVQRAKPLQAAEIAAFITRLTGGKRSLTRGDIMAAFGEKAYLLLRRDKSLIGLVGWQVENLVARVDDIYIVPEIEFDQAMKTLVEGVERASRELQCEIALVFLSPAMASLDSIWSSLGYQLRAVKDLQVRAWQEAAAESLPGGMRMLFKQLRKDRVLRPV